VNCSHLIEHMHDPMIVLQEVYRVLRPGGLLYIEAPDMRSTLLPHLPGVAPEGMFNFWDDPTHIRPYTRIALKSLCRICGFVGVKTMVVRDWLLVLSIPRSVWRFVRYRHNKYITNVLAPIGGLFVSCLARKPSCRPPAATT
jgi:SAM-dependent methyltransferase